MRPAIKELLLLDEPLNNLDYNNIRAFSNILTQVYHSKPGLGIILTFISLKQLSFSDSHDIISL